MKIKTLTCDVEPYPGLVDWVEKMKDHLLYADPSDRPWYHSTVTPVASDVGWSLWCHCDREVPMTMLETQNNTSHVFLGQCLHCQSILWATQ